MGKYQSSIFVCGYYCFLLESGFVSGTWQSFINSYTLVHLDKILTG